MSLCAFAVLGERITAIKIQSSFPRKYSYAFDDWKLIFGVATARGQLKVSMPVSKGGSLHVEESES